MSTTVGSDGGGRVMSARRQARLEEQRRSHRTLLADPAALAALDAEAGRLDLAAGLARTVPSATELAQRAGLVRRLVPAEEGRLRSACQAAQEHRIRLLGAQPTAAGEPFDWHRDRRSGRLYPADPDYLAMGNAAAFALLVDREGGSELKYPWDLSNLHWVPTLAAGRFLFDDASCTASFAADLEDWLRANPFCHGVNWLCPMNIAIRAANLLAGLSAFLPDLDPNLVAASRGSLLRHGLAIMGNLEVWGGSGRNNHYLTNVMGMYLLGQVFRDLPLGSQWLAFATDELEHEACYQFHDDGSGFEDSTSYHRLSAEMLLLCAISARRAGSELSEGFHQRLRLALGVTRLLSGPDGQVPQFGDNDNGRILQFHGYGSVPCTDHRHLLAVGGEFYGVEVLRLAGVGAESEALWLLGSWTATSGGRVQVESMSLPRGGLHLHRCDQGILAMRCGAIDANCGGGHAHCDQLAFTLHTVGGALFVDAGSYLYSSDFAARNDFRSVEWHNTVQIGDLPLHTYDRTTFSGLWSMTDASVAEVLAAGADADGIWRFAGRHRGFAAANCLVERRCAWDAPAGRLSISDRVSPLDPQAGLAAGTQARSRLMFAPGLEVRVAGADSLVALVGHRTVATLRFTGAELLALRLRWYSPEYGRRVPVFQLEAMWHPAGSPELRMEIDHACNPH